MMQSAVRIPTPEPGDAPEAEVPATRSSISRSPSPRQQGPPRRERTTSRSTSPPPRNAPLPRDVDRSRAFERARQFEIRQRAEAGSTKPLTEAEKQAAAKAEYERLLNMRSGGTYIPPARLKALQAQITDKSSKEYQRMAWEALKKSINGLINKVNVSNIKHIVPELFNENLVRGRGLFCRSIMKAQAASLPFTPIYAAMAAVVNTKLPQVGELLVNRLIIQFRKAFKRNDKGVCLSSTTFIAHLINQQVAHEMLAAQMLLLLLHKPTDDSVEIAVGLMKEVGQHMEEMNSQIALAVFDQFRSILHEADIDKRVQYMIEVLFQIRKDRYKDHPAVRDELDLVEEEDQITHRTGLEDQLVSEDGLNVFKYDPDFEANEEAYRKLKAEILGEESGSSEEDEEDEDESSEEEDEAEKALEIKDQSNTDLVNLRRSIYLTIMSSGGFEEATHKLMRINLPAGREEELPSMIIECASQERTYNKFFGLIGERFCKLNRLWKDLFEQMFVKYYETIHRYETNRLRIIAQFFGHLLASDAICWDVFHVIKLNEEDTTSASRIFIKILIDDLAQGIGMKDLTERLKSEDLQPALTGMFPTDNPKNTRFSINFFTAIGMGVLTEGMREWLKNMPKPAPATVSVRSPTPTSRGRSESVSSYSSYSSYSSRSRSDSQSRSRSRTPQRRERGREVSRDHTPRRERDYSSSRSRARLRRRDRSSSYDSRPPPKRRRNYSASRSRSPRRRHARSYSSSYDSRSPLPTRSRRYSSISRSPPRRGGTKRRRTHSPDDSLSPPRRKQRGRSYTRSLSSRPRRLNSSASGPSRSPPSRKRARSESRSLDDSRSSSPRPSPAPTRGRNQTFQKGRRNSSSPETSRSQTPPPGNNETRRTADDSKREISVAKESNSEEDLSQIHPSRRVLMGAIPGGRGGGKAGRGGRAKASDFI
ncbi:hypothetical protein M433DRAFT_152878 [Acidomyces richmondensis BFW]|nr:MAG: hypothetical protein FE78DRAFT_88409 [Acidomyces sp. 'richmondensis']KYG46896.1 hypothetical protein M433DRAFT_152878 [Acidomyces richmondensis BFW]